MIAAFSSAPIVSSCSPLSVRVNLTGRNYCGRLHCEGVDDDDAVKLMSEAVAGVT
jgi:hypothetical protein